MSVLLDYSKPDSRFVILLFVDGRRSVCFGHEEIVFLR